MIEPRPEERNHINVGPVVRKVRVGEAEVYCLCRKKDRALLWTADIGAARAAELPSNNKGDFLGWIPNERIEFLPVAP